jgi:hypothetical protein
MYAGAAVLTVAATALGITSFIMLMRRQPADAPNKPAGEQPPPAGVATDQGNGPHAPNQESAGYSSGSPS